MSVISRIATSALDSYGLKQAVTANNIANVNTPDFKASDTVMKENMGGGVNAVVRHGTDSVDISKEAVDLMSTSTNYKSNLKAFTSADDMLKGFLDMVK